MIQPSEYIGELRYPVVTMGTFDGVHLGHQQLLQRVISRSRKMNGESVVITYYHHPKEVLNRSLTQYLLTERDRKTELIKEIGIDYILYLKFDQQMAYMKAEEFLKEILIDRVKAREIVFGYDCHFGYQREGDYHFLKDREKIYGYRSSLVRPVKIGGRIVSSSLIRNLIRSGQVEEAEKYLGRYYDLEGTVESGSGIGRKIGFPTLNIVPIDSYKLLPSNGVYFGKATVDEKEFFCLTNVGYCPTLKDMEERSIESYLIGFAGELYDKKIKVNFLARLRDEKKFPDQEALIEAIRQDILVAKDLIDKVKSGKLQRNQ